MLRIMASDHCNYIQLRHGNPECKQLCAPRPLPGYAAPHLATRQMCGANRFATQHNCARHWVRRHQYPHELRPVPSRMATVPDEKDRRHLEERTTGTQRASTQTLEYGVVPSGSRTRIRTRCGVCLLSVCPRESVHLSPALGASLVASQRGGVCLLLRRAQPARETEAKLGPFAI